MPHELQDRQPERIPPQPATSRAPASSREPQHSLAHPRPLHRRLARALAMSLALSSTRESLVAPRHPAWLVVFGPRNRLTLAAPAPLPAPLAQAAPPSRAPAKR